MATFLSYLKLGNQQTQPTTNPQTSSSNSNVSPRRNPSNRPNNTRERSNSQELSSLKNDLKIKESLIESLNSKVANLENELIMQQNTHQIQDIPQSQLQLIPSTPTKDRSLLSPEAVAKRSHPLTPVSHLINDRGRVTTKMGTRGSITTSSILEALPEIETTPTRSIAEKFLQIFQSPADYLTYLQSPSFAEDLQQLCEAVGDVLVEEPRCLFMQSPVYVFGDIHGNLEDLHFFADNVWKLGIDLTAGHFLFLGDYVDRGLNSLECVAYLFGMKLLYPKKVHMLRGNHETRDVNGWIDHYREKSFLYQCRDRFGEDLGNRVWEACNSAFDRLPLSAVVDHEIFCIHGGIPRPVQEFESEIQAIMALPTVASIMPAGRFETEGWMRSVSSDCIWSDPASEAMEPVLDDSGFGASPRGGDAVMFGSVAIDNFLQSNNLSYIIRAHEAHAHGVSLSKGARVFTVFSTSKDHRQGGRALAGCILIDVDQIHVINRSPKYRNKYVHRRTSLCLENLSEDEIERRRRLGLIRMSAPDEEYFRLKEEEEEDEALEEERKAQINGVDISQFRAKKRTGGPRARMDTEDDEEDSEESEDSQEESEEGVLGNGDAGEDSSESGSSSHLTTTHRISF